MVPGQFTVTPYTLALAAAATLQLGLTVVAWQHRDERLSVILGGLLVAAAIWCLAYAMQLSSGDASTAAFWNDVRLLGPTVVSPLLFLFAAAYTDREEWLGRRRLAALFAVPVVTNLLAWTPATSELVRRDRRVPAGGTLYTESVIGPWGVRLRHLQLRADGRGHRPPGRRVPPAASRVALPCTDGGRPRRRARAVGR
jgi:hypothetical protein